LRTRRLSHSYRLAVPWCAARGALSPVNATWRYGPLRPMCRTAMGSFLRPQPPCFFFEFLPVGGRLSCGRLDRLAGVLLCPGVVAAELVGLSQAEQAVRVLAAVEADQGLGRPHGQGLEFLALLPIP